MPEFYDCGACGYQSAAQPYLDAIARGIRDDGASRKFLLEGTEYAQSFGSAKPLWRKQWDKRDPTNAMKGGSGIHIEFAKRHFDRVIIHEDARSTFPNYPAALTLASPK